MAAIEAERARLMQAESLLQCILIAMEYDGNEVRKPYYPTLIELARNLVNKSIGQLDSVRMRPLIEDSKRSEAYGSAEQKDPAQHEHMVKDSAKVLYLS